MRMQTIRRCYKWIAFTASPSSIDRPSLRRDRVFRVSLRPRVNEEFMSLLWEEKKVDCPRAGWSDVEGSWFAQDAWCCLFSTLWNAKVVRLFYQRYHLCLPITMTQRGAKREHVWKQGFNNHPKELACIRCSTKPEDHSQSRSQDTSRMQGSRSTYSCSWTKPEGSAPKNNQRPFVIHLCSLPQAAVSGRSAHFHEAATKIQKYWRGRWSRHVTHSFHGRKRYINAVLQTN